MTEWIEDPVDPALDDLVAAERVVEAPDDGPDEPDADDPDEDEDLGE